MSPSPVAMYMMSGFVGSIAMSLTPKTGSVSVRVRQVVPPSVVFHNPPAGAPIQNVFASVG